MGDALGKHGRMVSPETLCTMALMNVTILPGEAALPLWLLTRYMPLLSALGFTSAFALGAWGLRAVSLSGAFAGLLLTVVVCMAAGPPGFLAVLTLFLLTFLATRFGYAQKRRRGTAERNGGRTAIQIMANLGPACMTIVPLLLWRPMSYVLLAGFTAAIAEAAADTVSGELGQVLSPRKAYLVTSWESVDSGTNGAVSFAGCVAGLLASGMICGVCQWFDLLLPRWFWLTTLAGFAGMLLDSVLGATLEGPERLGNNSVNFISGVFSAFVAILLAFVFR
jgi:uncharacterized protein (TIGR00297 family)